MWAEVRRRNVFKVAAAYAVVGWLLVQAADIMLTNFGAPDWVFKSFVGLIILGFPMAVFMAWAYELTPEGIKKTRDVPLPESISRYTGRRLDFLIIGVLALAVALLVFDKFVLTEPTLDDPVARLDGAAAALDPSIAVLPFADMSAEGDQGYFADGLSEEILNLLARGGVLRVTARTSSFSFKGRDVPVPEIARTLGVAHVLEGSVRKSGDRLRITAQLIEAESGFHRWSETFDRPVQDIFVIQDEIAGAIASALEVNLTGQAVATGNLEAYELYLEARPLIYQRQSEALQTARGLIDQALALDPDYPPALAASAEVWLLLAAGTGTYGDVPLNQTQAAAEPLLERALAIDPELADAHAVSGLLSYQRRELPQARDYLARALEINPSHVGANNWYANLLGDSGLLNQAIAARRQLQEVDPLFATNLMNLSNNLSEARQFEEAETWARHLLELFPEHYYGHSALAYLFLCQGRHADALTEIERGLALDPSVGAMRFWAELIHLNLGALDEWEEQSIGIVWIWAPIFRGEVETGLARGWQRLGAAPDNPPIVVTMLEALSATGRHQELLDWVGGRWGGAAGLADWLGNAGVGRYLLPVAAAQRATGRTGEFEQTLDLLGQRWAYLSENGHDNPFADFVKSGLLGLKDDREQGLPVLEAAIEAGLRHASLDYLPAFETWRDDPEFQRLAARMTDLVNAEREKAGMGPLPPDQQPMEQQPMEDQP